MGDVVDVDFDGHERLGLGVGDLVDDHDVRLPGRAWQEADGVERGRRGEHHGGLCVAKRRLEAFGVARSSGANSGTAMVPALIAAKKPAT